MVSYTNGPKDKLTDKVHLVILLRKTFTMTLNLTLSNEHRISRAVFYIIDFLSATLTFKPKFFTHTYNIINNF